MRLLSNIPNTDAPSSDYPGGKIRNKNISNVPPIIGTPIIEELYGDIVQFFQRLLVLGSVTANNLADNVTNGYQTITALWAAIRGEFTASNEETIAGTINNKYVTPEGLFSIYDFNLGGGFTLEADVSTINISTAVVNHVKIGKKVTMNIVLEFDVIGTQSYIGFKSQTDQSIFNAYNTGNKSLIWHTGVIKNSLGMPQVGLCLLNTNADFGFHIHRYDGTDFVSGLNYYANFTITYFTA